MKDVSNAWKNYSLFSDLLEIYKEEEKDFNNYVSELCTKYSVILFGSRARKDNKIYSDYDILVIGNERPPLPPTDAIDVHFVKVSLIDSEIKDFNTIVIDAFYEGIILCDTLNIYEKAKNMVIERIRGLKRIKDGWEKI